MDGFVTHEAIDAMAAIDAIAPRKVSAFIINLRVGQVMEIVTPAGESIRVEMVAKNGNWGRLRVLASKDFAIKPP